MSETRYERTRDEERVVRALCNMPCSAQLHIDPPNRRKPVPMSYVADYLEAMNEILKTEFELHQDRDTELSLLQRQRAVVRAFLGTDGGAE